MSKPITGADLKKALGEGLDEMLEEVARAINSARAGRIIAESEEPVRDAVGVFRQRLYQMAVEIRQHNEEGAFSPCGAGWVGAITGQGSADDLARDGKWEGGDKAQGVLGQGKAGRRTGGRVAGDKP